MPKLRWRPNIFLLIITVSQTPSLSECSKKETNLISDFSLYHFSYKLLVTQFWALSKYLQGANWPIRHLAPTLSLLLCALTGKLRARGFSVTYPRPHHYPGKSLGSDSGLPALEWTRHRKLFLSNSCSHASFYGIPSCQPCWVFRYAVFITWKAFPSLTCSHSKQELINSNWSSNSSFTEESVCSFGLQCMLPTVLIKFYCHCLCFVSPVEQWIPWKAESVFCSSLAQCLAEIFILLKWP